MAKGYSEDDVKSIQGLAAVRKKASMYIGSTDEHGVWTILREAADNTVDEALAGRNKACFISIEDDGSYIVADKGGGIPIKDITIKDAVSGKAHKVSALRGVVGVIHTGAKFDNKAYAASRGSHGIGIKATNALSKEFKVWTYRNEQWYSIEYERGELKQDVAKAKAPKVGGRTFSSGTVVRFTPDEKIFNKTKLPLNSLFEWAQITAYLTPGFTIVVQKGKKKKVFYEKDGIKAYLKKTVEDYKCQPLGKWFEYHDPLVNCGIVFTDYDGQGLRSHTNGLYNGEGGAHLNATYRAAFNALQKYKKAKQKFTIKELKEGILGIVNVSLSAPKFSSQNKIKLVDERADEPLLEVLEVAFKKFFSEHKALAQRICERCDKLKDLMAGFTASKKVLKAMAKIRREGFPTKFVAAQTKVAEDRETYFVEGDSAGGSAKQARNKKFQEVLPLKGKIINSMRKPSAALNSLEVIYILTVIGIQPNTKDPYGNLRTGKIILMCDADPDGSHINSLVLTCIFRFCPELIKMGMVYVLDAPEYISVNPKSKKLIGSKTLAGIIDKVGEKAKITHVKGWGELNPDQVEQLAMDPEQRRLIKIMPAQGSDKKDFVKLMSEDVEYRRELLGV